jgi:Na+/melibiose symporter-like transporter
VTAQGSRQASRRRSYVGLIGADTFVLIADQLLAVAVPLYVLDNTHSATVTAAVSLARVIPGALLGAIGGTVVDRVDRRRLLVTGALTRGLLALLLAGALMAEAGLGVLFALTVALACLAPLSGPAVGASLPSVVSQDDLPRANAQLAARSVLLQLSAPTAGAVLYAAAGLTTVVVLDAALYATAALVWRLTTMSKAAPTRGNRFLTETLDGLRLVSTDPVLARLLACVGLALVGLSLELAVLVPFIRTVLHGSHEAVGLLTSVEAVGGLVAATAFPRLHRRLGMSRLLRLGMLGLPLATLGFLASRDVATAVPAVLGAGLLLTLLTATVQVHMQSTVEPGYLGRVLGVIGSIVGLSAVLGTGLAVGLSSVLTLRQCLAVAAAIEVIGVGTYLRGAGPRRTTG